MCGTPPAKGARARVSKKRQVRLWPALAVLAAINHEGMPALTSKSQLLSWLDGQLSRSHDRAVFDLPASSARDAGEPVGPMSSSPRPDAAVKDAARGRHREAAHSPDSRR